MDLLPRRAARTGALGQPQGIDDGRGSLGRQITFSLTLCDLRNVAIITLDFIQVNSRRADNLMDHEARDKARTRDGVGCRTSSRSFDG